MPPASPARNASKYQKEYVGLLCTHGFCPPSTTPAAGYRRGSVFKSPCPQLNNTHKRPEYFYISSRSTSPHALEKKKTSRSAHTT